MANLKSFKPTNEWKNINDYIPTAVGTYYSFTNEGTSSCLFFLGSNPNDEDATVLSPYSDTLVWKGDGTLYVKSLEMNNSLIKVQDSNS